MMQTLNSIDISGSTPPEFSGCLNSIKKNHSLLEDPNRIFDTKSLLKYENSVFCLPPSVCAIKSEMHQVTPPLREKFFTESTRCYLQSMYSKLYDSESITHIPLRYEEFRQCEVFGQVYYTSQKYRSKRSCAIMAMWPGITGNIMDRQCKAEDIRNGLIEFFVLHRPSIVGVPDNQPHILAKVKWYEDHPRKNWFKNSIVVCSALFVADSEASFIPVSRIVDSLAPKGGFFLEAIESGCLCADQNELATEKINSYDFPTFHTVWVWCFVRDKE